MTINEAHLTRALLRLELHQLTIWDRQANYGQWSEKFSFRSLDEHTRQDEKCFNQHFHYSFY